MDKSSFDQFGVLKEDYVKGLLNGIDICILFTAADETERRQAMQFEKILKSHEKLRSQMGGTQSHYETERQRDVSDRNMCVSLITRMAKVMGLGVGLADLESPTFGHERVVILDLPAGQVSWRIPNEFLKYFAHLDEYPGQWDGHSVDDKHERMLDPGWYVKFATMSDLSARLIRAEDVVRYAKSVMTSLEASGGSIVPHLIDTDDNDGQRLREAIQAYEQLKKED